MFRYLINISYIGTPFRGIQRQVSLKKQIFRDPTTIQGQIEIGLQKLGPINSPYTILSSRTDAGVHAFNSTLHVDLERPNEQPYDPLSITEVLNTYFYHEEIPIQVQKTFLVPNDFHCRFHAISRTYMYRIGVIPGEYLTQEINTAFIPLHELYRSLFLRTNTFDIEAFEEACGLFKGYHDFKTFMHKSPKTPHKITKKVFEKCEIKESQLLCSNHYSWPKCVGNLDYKMYEITIKANGFLYKQVRRTVASLIAVAKGIITPRDLKFMLEIPSHRSWNPKIKTVPPFGLYLCEVDYLDKHRETFKDKL